MDYPLIKWKRRVEGDLFEYSIMTGKGRVEVQSKSEEDALKKAMKIGETVVVPILTKKATPKKLSTKKK